MERAGIGFPEHDARYAYGQEWISVVSRLLQGERITYKGAHFDVQDYALRPKDLYRPRPLIYVGGESEPARALVADHGDVWFINGQPLEDVAGLIADVGRGRAIPGRSVSAFPRLSLRGKPINRLPPPTNDCWTWLQRMRR